MDIITYAILHKQVDTLSDKIDAFPGGFSYKGAVDYYDDLPSSGNTVGDCYSILYKGSSGTEPDNSRYAWGEIDGVEQWIEINPVPETMTAEDVDDLWEDA